MEFVGRTVRKEFKGFGVFSGVVKSYDSSSGFFKIGYEDGDSEEIDFSELAALLDVDGVLTDHSSSLLIQNTLMVGRGPQGRRIVLGLASSGLKSQMQYLDSNGKGNADDHSVKKEQHFDLNMDIEHPENINQDVDLGGYVKGENSNGNQTSNVSIADVSPFVDYHGNLGSGKTRSTKRRKLTDSSKTSSESAIRRSSRRRAKFSSEDLEPVSASEESEEPSFIPPKLELPPSTGDMNLDDLPVLDLFSVYAFLRSFSTLLFLSPFELGDFVASIRSKSPSLLIDSIHVSLLRILRKHLEFLSSENSTSATNCLRDLNWDLLDSITWPIFMVEYLLMKPDFDLANLKLFKTDYYKQPKPVKVKILQYICDDVVEVEPISSELSRRSLGGEYTEFDQPAIKKRKATMGISGSSEEVIDETADWNSDECYLCKMDGNLICCDGCPAAFHSKCVGIATNLLPAGDWFCPECVVDKKNGGIDVSKVIRGAELLGVDPHGRLYYCSCGYILVSDNCDAETSFHYYHMTNLTAFINALDSSEGPYQDILNAITNHWSLYEKLHGATLPFESSNSAHDDNALTEGHLSLISVESSEISAAVPDILDPSKIDYLNLYSFARVASSVVGEWTRKPSEKVSQIPTKSLEELISIQMKSIAKTSVDFSWSNIRNLSLEARKEKCGWCLACQYPTDDGNCLFYMNDNFLESFSSDLIGFDSRIERKDRLIDVMCHILCIEDRLHGLLLGPWLNPNFPNLYRKSFVEASDIAPVKDLLLMLESNIRPRALSDEWLKHVDSVVTVGSASHIVSMPPKIVIGRKRPQLLDSKPISSKNTSSGLGLFWWRGGGLTRQLFNWKVLPRSVARKAARQGGGKKIEDILYPENSDFPKRTKVCSWRAAVESAVTVEQLALQIRELDANIKWEEIENTIHPAKMDKESLKYMRSFKKAIVRRKSSEGSSVKYLLDFGKRRFIPDKVIKHGSKLEESSSERKKYWVEEPYVPLFLLKAFEDRRIALKSNKKGPVSLPGSGTFRKPSRKDVFSYLFSKPEKPEDPQCGHCNKDVPIRDAVSCQLCEGFFHKKHAKKTSRGKEKCMYTCNNCHVGDTEKVVVPKKKKKKLNPRKTKKSVKVTEKSGKGKELVPVRRSTRAVKVVSFQIKKKTVKKRKPRKKKQMKSMNELVKPKGKRGRPRKIKKENFRKKRSRVYPTYWLNGLLLSRKPEDDRLMDFRAQNHLVSFERSGSVDLQPKCCLCCEPEFNSSLNYVTCVSCGEWYHGDAFGLKDEHIGVIIGFKCHKCRERPPPVCPHLHESKLGDAENGPESAETLKPACEGILGKERKELDNSLQVFEEVVDGV